MSERELARVGRDTVGFVFQAFHLVEELTAQENVELSALLARRLAYRADDCLSTADCAPAYSAEGDGARIAGVVSACADPPGRG